VMGVFWHISNRSLSGKMNVEVPDDVAILSQAIERLHGRISAARQSRFPNVPSESRPDGKCSNYCEFSRLCRTRANAAQPANSYP